MSAESGFNTTRHIDYAIQLERLNPLVRAAAKAAVNEHRSFLSPLPPLRAGRRS